MNIYSHPFNLNSFNMEISTNGWAFLDEKWHAENVRDHYSRLYFVGNGSGYLKYDGNRVIMEPERVYLVPAGLVLSYGCKSMEKFYFHINISGADKYDLFYGCREIHSLPFSKEKYEYLKILYKSENYIDKLHLKSMITETACEFAGVYFADGLSIKRYSEPVKKVLGYLHQNISISLSAKDISDSLFISESKIRKCFRDEVGVTLGKYIDDLVFMKAMRQLKKPDVTICEISDELGFCDQFYFSRRFKERYGKTPSEYKKEISVYF